MDVPKTSPASNDNSPSDCEPSGRVAHGFGIVIVDLRRGFDHAIDRRQIAGEVGRQHLDRWRQMFSRLRLHGRSIVARRDRLEKVFSPAVGKCRRVTQVITTCFNPSCRTASATRRGSSASTGRAVHASRCKKWHPRVQMCPRYERGVFRHRHHPIRHLA